MSIQEIISNFSINLDEEDFQSSLPEWMSFLLLLGAELVSLPKDRQYLFGLSLPVINFCPLLIAAGANLHNLQANLRLDNKQTLSAQSMDDIDSNVVRFTVKDDFGKWHEKARYWRKLMIEDKWHYEFSKDIKAWGKKTQRKEIIVPYDEFNERVKSSSFTSSALEIPKIIEAIFPSIDINWFLEAGEISSTAIVDTKTKVFEDASNKIFYKNNSEEWIPGILSDICKVLDAKSKQVGSFTNIISSRKTPVIDIDKDLVIYTHSGYNKISASDQQKERIRIVIFDKSMQFSSIDEAKQKFYSDVSTLDLKKFDISSLGIRDISSASLIGYEY